jgi:hypothetical protein
MTLAKKIGMAKAEAEIADADDAGLPPQQPSAPTLELLMEAGFFDGPTTDDHPTSDGPFTRDNGEPDRGHARMMTPLAEAAVVLMPVCEAIRMSGPSPAQDEEDNAGRHAGWPVKCGKYMMIGFALLVFVAVGTLIAVVVMMVGFTKQDDPVTISTPSTAIMTSTSSTTTPEINTVIEKLTDFMLVVYVRRWSTSHDFIFRFLHLPSSPSPLYLQLSFRQELPRLSYHRPGSNRVWQSSEMLLVTTWQQWLSPRMLGLW